MNSTEVSYIYGLSSSANPEEMKYIGYSITPFKRFNKHISESKKLLYRRHKWIQSELNKKNNIILTILRCVPITKVSNSETETILFYKSLGANLTNGNNGGLGGISPSKEVREKLRLSKLGNKWNVGRKPSEKNRLILREINKRPKSKPNKNRTLSEEKVYKIFELYNFGIKIKYISEILEISMSTVSNVLYGNSYKDIKKKNNLILNKRFLTPEQEEEIDKNGR